MDSFLDVICEAPDIRCGGATGVDDDVPVGITHASPANLKPAKSQFINYLPAGSAEIPIVLEDGTGAWCGKMPLCAAVRLVVAHGGPQVCGDPGLQAEGGRHNDALPVLKGGNLVCKILMACVVALHPPSRTGNPPDILKNTGYLAIVAAGVHPDGSTGRPRHGVNEIQPRNPLFCRTGARGTDICSAFHVEGCGIPAFDGVESGGTHHHAANTPVTHHDVCPAAQKCHRNTCSVAHREDSAHFLRGARCYQGIRRSANTERGIFSQGFVIPYRCGNLDFIQRARYGAHESRIVCNLSPGPRVMNYRRDEQAFFNDVYTATFPLLYRVVLRIVGDSESAEEIAHDAFIRLYQHSTTLPDAQQAKFWVLRVGKNLAFNLAKRRGRERRAMERVYHEPARESRTADRDVLEEETVNAVRAAVDRLPKTLRDVIVLKEYGEMPYSEIAGVLGISEGNVKVRVYRARERLVSLLAGKEVQFRE